MMKSTEERDDLTGTARQVPDRPINMPLESTADIAICPTIRSVLLDTAVHGHIPVNAGLIRPITIVAPQGCLAKAATRVRAPSA